MRLSGVCFARLQRVQDWARLAQKANFRANGLARNCDISLRHLERFFVAQIGTTPQEWLNSLRQQKAIELIIQGKPIKEVAYELGYKQVSHFSREFKRAHGVAPSKASLSSNVASGYEMSPLDTRAQLNDERGRGLLSNMRGAQLHEKDEQGRSHERSIRVVIHRTCATEIKSTANFEP